MPNQISPPEVEAHVRRQPVVQDRDHAGARDELRVVPQPRRGRRRALDAPRRRRRRRDLRRHRLGRRARSTCRRGRRRTSACRSPTRSSSTAKDIDHDREVGASRRPARRAGIDADHAEAGAAGHAAAPRRRAADAAGLRRARSATPNDYRCFVLDPHFTKADLHHRLRGHARAPHRDPPRADLPHRRDRRPRPSDAASGSDGKPGWSCYAGPDLAVARTRDGDHARSRRPEPKRHRVPGFTGQPGLIAGWVPGQDPVIYPDTLRHPVAAG